MTGPEKFGGDYRNSPHFIENPLEETEAVMQSLWSRAQEVQKKFSDTDEAWKTVEKQMEEFQKQLDSLKGTSFWKRYFMSDEDKARIKILEEGMAKVRPDMAKKDEEIASLKKDLENVSRMLKVAEENWKKGLNA